MNRIRPSSYSTLAAATTRWQSRRSDNSAIRSTDRLASDYHDAHAVHDTVALVLAGGRGTRLLPLTQRRCKPAVPFGGSFRIIDFTLSNCVNSGIRRIGVLTQYEQHSLIRHLQDAWNFLRRDQNEFIDVMPAQLGCDRNWYQGTADAVTKNLDMLKKLAPRHTLILAGDHIYKADYRRMITEHIDNQADVTIACCAVPVTDAHQFGIVGTNSKNRIIRFDEKPACTRSMRGHPGLAQASMGLYLFNTERLIETLEQDQLDPESSHDFGHDIIPSLIKSHRVWAYRFEQGQEAQDYWRDVGTLDAYYEANMQLLDPQPPIELYCRDWQVHTSPPSATPAHFISDSLGHRGLATDCIIGSGCVLHGAQIRHSILFSDVCIHDQSLVQNSLVLPGASIGRRCRIRNAIIDSGTRIADGTEIGYDACQDALRYKISERGIVVVKQGSENRCGTLSNARCRHTAMPETAIE